MEHGYSSYIRQLHDKSDQKHIEAKKLIQKLDRQYGLLDEALFVGFGWQPHAAAIKATLGSWPLTLICTVQGHEKFSTIAGTACPAK